MLLMVLFTDIHQLRIVDIVVTLTTVHIAIGQVHPELVPGGMGVLLHVAAPATEVDAGEAGVESGARLVTSVTDAGGGLPLPGNIIDWRHEPGVNCSVGLNSLAVLVSLEMGTSFGSVHHLCFLSVFVKS